MSDIPKIHPNLEKKIYREIFFTSGIAVALVVFGLLFLNKYNSSGNYLVLGGDTPFGYASAGLSPKDSHLMAHYKGPYFQAAIDITGPFSKKGVSANMGLCVSGSPCLGEK